MQTKKKSWSSINPIISIRLPPLLPPSVQTNVTPPPPTQTHTHTQTQSSLLSHVDTHTIPVPPTPTPPRLYSQTARVPTAPKPLLKPLLTSHVTRPCLSF